MDPTVQHVATVLGGALAVFGAFVAWLVRHMDRRFDDLEAHMNRCFDEFNAHMNRRFDEAKAHMNRRFDEAKAHMSRRFDEAKADTGHRFDEANANTGQRFDEANANTRQGFDRMREDHLRLEKKLDSHAAQIADLRQDVGRLQGIVERTHDPARFVVPPVREVSVGEEVREAPASYDTEPGGEGPERKDEP